AIALAILALAAIVIAAASVVTALGLRVFLRMLHELAGPAVGDVRGLVATIRTEAEGLAGTSRELRQRIVTAADAAEARLAELDARHACLPGRVGPRQPASAVGCRGRPAPRISLRLPVRQHRRRHLDGQEVRTRGPALPRLARGPGNLRLGPHRSAARVRPRLSV